MTPENKKWVWSELTEIAKQASAVIVATVTLGGFVVTTWKYLDLPIPTSVNAHNRDMKNIEARIDNQYAQLKRMSIENGISIMQMRITNIAVEIHNMDDAVSVHQRSLINTQFPDADKDVARRRIVTLIEAKESLIMRQKAIYAQITKMQDAMQKLPYDPKIGDIYDASIPEIK